MPAFDQRTRRPATWPPSSTSDLFIFACTRTSRFAQAERRLVCAGTGTRWWRPPRKADFAWLSTLRQAAVSVPERDPGSPGAGVQHARHQAAVRYASGERAEMKPEPAVPAARPGEVVPLAGAQVLVLLGCQRCEGAAELLHHVAVQQAGVADPGHPEPGEFGQGGCRRGAED